MGAKSLLLLLQPQGGSLTPADACHRALGTWAGSLPESTGRLLVCAREGAGNAGLTADCSCSARGILFDPLFFFF